MTDKLMQEVQDASKYFQECYANVLRLADEEIKLQESLSTNAGLRLNAQRALEQAKTRLHRASLALDPYTSMET